MDLLVPAGRLDHCEGHTVITLTLSVVSLLATDLQTEAWIKLTYLKGDISIRRVLDQCASPALLALYDASCLFNSQEEMKTA